MRGEGARGWGECVVWWGWCGVLVCEVYARARGMPVAALSATKLMVSELKILPPAAKFKLGGKRFRRLANSFPALDRLAASDLAR